MKTNSKIILGIVVAVLLSTISCYVLAETLINSKDVVYEDNSNLVADNVQDAIDGTCTKIDTRLSDIEDKLYIFNQINIRQEFTSATTLSYTGISIKLPSNSYCTVTGQISLSGGYPSEVRFCYSSTEAYKNSSYSNYTTDSTAWYTSTTYSLFTGNSEPVLYLWAKYNNVSKNGAVIYGYCATKYK